MSLPHSPLPTILITGATGFLGGALAAEMLSTAEWESIVLLVRAEDDSHAYQRVVRSLARFITDIELLGRIRREQIICGDFTQPGAFVGDGRLIRIKKVVHCAALTSFGANTRVFSTNIDGTLTFVHHLRQVCKIERFLHVSTAMICGDDPASVVLEDSYPNRKVKHLVNYTESKAEAERLLRLTLPGFPIVVVRPSIIVGHTRLGCAPSGSIYWTFRMADALGMITCGSDAKIDVIPVDYAASCIRHLLLKTHLSNKTYHIAAGSEQSCTWRQIARAFAATRAPAMAMAAGSETMAVIGMDSDADATDYRTVPFDAIAARRGEFDQVFGPCNKKFMLGAAALYAGFAALNVTFDISRLQMEGVPPSPRFSDYLGICEQSSSHQTIAEQGLIDFA